MAGCGQEPILAWLRLDKASDGSRGMQRCHQPMVFEAAISAAVLVTQLITLMAANSHHGLLMPCPQEATYWLGPTMQPLPVVENQRLDIADRSFADNVDLICVGRPQVRAALRDRVSRSGMRAAQVSIAEPGGPQRSRKEAAARASVGESRSKHQGHMRLQGICAVLCV